MDVSLFGESPSVFTIQIGVSRRPSGQPIRVSVVHAEGSRDQDRVVDLLVRGPLLPGAEDVLARDLLAAALYFASNGKQRLHLLRDCGHLEIRLHTIHELLISVEPVSSHGAVRMLAEVAIVLR